MKSPKEIQFEPFKIKMVEPINYADPFDGKSILRREEILKRSYFNVFNIPAKEILIDLLTDSGTGAMSHHQWAALMLGDESYAQATSFENFENSIKSTIGADYLITPTHQGRAAENILFYVLNNLVSDSKKFHEIGRRRVLINSFFDTTASNVALHGVVSQKEIQELGIDPSSAADRATRKQLETKTKYAALIEKNQLVVDQKKPQNFEHKIFGGNIDLDRLEAILADDRSRRQVMLVMLTVTNNTSGGLPVSMSNMRAVREMIDHYAKDDEPLIEDAPPLMLYMDAARFAENAYFIQQNEPGYADKSVAEIALEMFSHFDGCTMSAKKDGMVNIGGFLASKHSVLQRLFWEHMVEVEGFYTYGGLAGRDLEAIAVGMREGVDDKRVKQRIDQVKQLWTWLNGEGIPVKEPCGGHGVFVKGREFWTKDGKPMIAAEDLPGQTFTLELYRRYGIRCCEIGTVMFGDYNPQTGKPDKVAPDEDYVRLAIPRRTYTNLHLEYIAASICEFHANRESCPWKGMKFAYRPPALPHFLSHFEPISN